MFDKYYIHTLYEETYDDDYDDWMPSEDIWTKYYGPFNGLEIKAFMIPDSNGVRAIDELGDICIPDFENLDDDVEYFLTSNSDGVARTSRVWNS